MAFGDVMKALEKAGSAQTRKTYARHGAAEPMFGVSFATLATLAKKIGVDHDLALRLWDTGNFDARNLAFKIADPARMTAADLDRWATDTEVRMCSGYVSMLAAEGPDGLSTAKRWLSSKSEHHRCAGWGVVSQLAARDEDAPDAWFSERLAQIEKTIHAAPNGERYAMNNAVIAISGRTPALKKTALAASKRIGKVQVDHGDTDCKTPDAASYVEKAWAYAKSKGFESPSAQERRREPPRTRC
jgi:3-methyladenine DNA glycosylase AlkD